MLKRDYILGTRPDLRAHVHVALNIYMLLRRIIEGFSTYLSLSLRIQEKRYSFAEKIRAISRLLSSAFFYLLKNTVRYAMLRLSCFLVITSIYLHSHQTCTSIRNILSG